MWSWVHLNSYTAVMDVMLLVETLEQDEGRPQFVIDAVLLTITTVQVIMTINGE